MPKANFFFKCCVVGDMGVGKTNLLSRFAKDEFSTTSKATVGCEYMCKQIQHDGQTIEAQVWDTAGQERYKAVTQAFFRGCMGALIIYDITKRDSFENCHKWLKELRTHTDQSVVAMLVGNKIDLRHQQAVHVDDAKDFAEDNNLAFIETSARDATNVDLAFETILIEIYRIVRKGLDHGKYDPDRPAPSMLNVVPVTPSQNRPKEAGCC